MATKPTDPTDAAAGNPAGTSKNEAEKLAKCGAETVNDFGALLKAYQDMATRHFERMTSSIQSLATAKTPFEFMELQQKLIMESIDSVVADSRAITEMTVSLFSGAVSPMQKQIEAFQDLMKKSG